MTRSAKPDFTPPLGLSALTPFYNVAIALFTREGAWRKRLVETLSPQSGDVILDIGCGTGTLARFIHRACPDATYIGIDPDEPALAIARKRAASAGLSARFLHGFFDGTEIVDGRAPNKMVTSLVLHQTPLEEKRRIINAVHKWLPADGMLVIADYGAQPTALMRFLFRWTVQALDGVTDTQPNADGALPDLLRQAGFSSITETAAFSTLSGSISVLRALKALPDAEIPA